MTSFSPILKPDLEQGKLMAAANSRKERLKNMSSVVRNGLKFGKIPSTHLSIVYEIVKKKMDIANLIIVEP